MRPHLPLPLLAIVAAGIGVRLWMGPFIVDDAYITFRYARNLAEGAGFVYNAGERVLGTTTPLLTLVLALFARLGADVPQTAFLLGVAADAVTFVVLYRLTAGLSRGWVGLVAAALLAVTPRYLTYSVSGMETPLYIAAILVSLLLYQTDRTRAAAFVCALTVLLRPDGMMLAAVLGGHILFVRRRAPSRELIVFGATLAPWLVFTTFYFGSPLPSSVVAKAGQAASAGGTALANLIGFFTDTLVFTGLSVCALAGLAGGVARRLRLESWLAWGVGYTGAFTVTGAFSFFPWYYTPILPLYFALAALGLGEAGRLALQISGLDRMWTPLAGRITATALVAAILTSSLPAAIRHRETLERWADGREALYRRVAQEIGRAGGATGLMAASEIGALGYFHQGPILDLVGLVSPDAIGRSDRENLEQSRPAWIVSYDTHLDRRLIETPWFTRRYRLRWRHVVSPERALVAFARIETGGPDHAPAP